LVEPIFLKQLGEQSDDDELGRGAGAFNVSLREKKKTITPCRDSACFLLPKHAFLPFFGAKGRLVKPTSFRVF
jgi:hypothetical protein